MDMRIVFSGGKKVDALYKGFTIRTDQPESAGGGNSAPSPFDLFLCSIGTCAGSYVLSFCQERGIPDQGIELVLKSERNQETGLIGKIGIEIRLPAEFPPQYQEAVLRVAGLCTVKKHLAHPPEFEIYATSKT
jgi:putative redox protein